MSQTVETTHINVKSLKKGDKFHFHEQGENIITFISSEESVDGFFYARVKNMFGDNKTKKTIFSDNEGVYLIKN